MLLILQKKTYISYIHDRTDKDKNANYSTLYREKMLRSVYIMSPTEENLYLNALISQRIKRSHTCILYINI